MFENFDDKAIAAVMIAQQEAYQLGQKVIGTELLLLGLMAQGSNIVVPILKEQGLTLRGVQDAVESKLDTGRKSRLDEIPFAPETKHAFEKSIVGARQFQSSYVYPEHLFLAIVQPPETQASQLLQDIGLDVRQLEADLIRAILEKSPVTVGGDLPSRSEFSKADSLESLLTDLTKLAEQGKIDPVVGRAKEIQRVVQILGRRSKNNPILIGEPGVGKTAIAEGLAQRIVNCDVPETLLNQRVLSLDMGALMAGTQLRGEFEGRLKQLVTDIREAENIILLIDEVHTLVGTGSIGGSTDAANLLKPALARGELQCIGATTLDEYREHIEKDAALERRFQSVMVNEPTPEDALEILHGIRANYEAHHKLTISDNALEAAVSLSSRYISDRYLPDKAIDLIDEAGSCVHLRHAKSDTPTEVPMVTSEDIAQIVTSWTGIPVTQITETESSMLVNLEETLHQQLIGQEQAVQSVAKAIRRARSGLRSASRPIASFIFCGPTGVGKTELTKALANTLFNSTDSIIRLDMSEYMESQAVSKLIGSPPGYVGYGDGGQLTEAVRRKPYSIILLDEIEKAHPDVFNLLLQVLEDGRLSDSQGRVVNFSNTLIIMTSNIGSRSIEKQGSGFGFEITDADLAVVKYNRTREQVNDALKLFFRPELINRLDEIIVFQQLTREQVAKIADLQLDEVLQRLADRNITFEVTDAFKARLIEDGYDPSYGARPLRRAITRLVEDALAEAILSGQLQSGDTAVLDVDSDNQVQVRMAAMLVPA